MATNSKVNVIETANFADLETLINDDITTEEASGLGVSSCETDQFVDPSDGSVKAIVVLTYNKKAGTP